MVKAKRLVETIPYAAAAKLFLLAVFDGGVTITVVNIKLRPQRLQLTPTWSDNVHRPNPHQAHAHGQPAHRCG